MKLELIISLLIVILLLVFVWKNRKKIIIQKMIFPLLWAGLYKTKIGLKSMESLANKHQKLMRIFGYIGIVVGYLGMILMIVSLVMLFVWALTAPEKAAGVAIIVPSPVQLPVAGVLSVPPLYWLLGIFVVATIHEFSHGVIARVSGLRVKSSGFAFLSIVIPVIPAAFVEPDEKQLNKAPRAKQLSVFAAGPFSNVLLYAVLMFIVVKFILVPFAHVVYDNNVMMVGFANDSFNISPSQQIGMNGDEIIYKMDDQSLIETEITDIIKEKKPGDTLSISASSGEYLVTLGTHPANSSRPYIGGIFIQPSNIMGYAKVYMYQMEQYMPRIKEGYLNYAPLIKFFGWFIGLIFWLVILNIGIGLFNLVPIGPLDGGRIMNTTLLAKFKPETVRKIMKYLSYSLVFILIVVMLRGCGL